MDTLLISFRRSGQAGAAGRRVGRRARRRRGEGGDDAGAGEQGGGGSLLSVLASSLEPTRRRPFSSIAGFFLLFDRTQILSDSLLPRQPPAAPVLPSAAPPCDAASPRRTSNCSPAARPSFFIIDKLFEDGVELPGVEKLGLLDRVVPRLLEHLRDAPDKKILRFEAPANGQKDKFAWLRDEEFARETLAGVNPYAIELVRGRRMHHRVGEPGTSTGATSFFTSGCVTLKLLWLKSS
uniref:Lipoxygenase domain-containing protein n=1 Tax=Oryza meridionalis TaxID=40149 RepID=A0A0E0DTG9_9ORYZ